jgi:hypothetical protein
MQNKRCDVLAVTKPTAVAAAAVACTSWLNLPSPAVAVPFAAPSSKGEAVFSIASVHDKDSDRSSGRDKDKKSSKEKDKFTAGQMQRFEQEGFVLVGQAAVSKDFTPKTPKGLKPIK